MERLTWIGLATIAGVALFLQPSTPPYQESNPAPTLGRFCTLYPEIVLPDAEEGGMALEDIPMCAAGEIPEWWDPYCLPTAGGGSLALPDMPNGLPFCYECACFVLDVGEGEALPLNGQTAYSCGAPDEEGACPDDAQPPCTTPCSAVPCSEDDSDDDGLSWPEDPDEPYPFSDQEVNWGDPDADGTPNCYDWNPMGDYSILNTSGFLPPGDSSDTIEHALEQHSAANGGSLDYDGSLLTGLSGDLNGDGARTLGEFLSQALDVLSEAQAQLSIDYSGSLGPEQFTAYQSDLQEIKGAAALILDTLTLGAPGMVNSPLKRSLSRLIDAAEGEISRVEMKIAEIDGLSQAITMLWMESISSSGAARMMLDGLASFASAFVNAVGNNAKPDEAAAEEGAFSDVAGFLTSLAGDPVKTGDGEFVYDATDLDIPGRGQPLSISRRYGSRTDRLGILGHNWSMPYMEAFLQIWWKSGQEGVDAVVIWWGNGNQSVLMPSQETAGLFEGVKGDFGKASFAETHTCPDQEPEPPGIKYRDQQGTEYWFTPPSYVQGTGNMSTSWLRAVTDSVGNAILISRDKLGRPTTVTDTLGRQLNFAYDGPDGLLLSKITDWTGESVRYFYSDPEYDLVRVEYIPTQYLNSSGQVAEATPFEVYEYNSTGMGISHNMTAAFKSSSSPAVEMQYYTNGGYSWDKVMSHTVAGKTTTYKYERLEEGESPLHPKIAHLTTMRYHDGQTELYWHGKGVLYAIETLTGLTDSVGNITTVPGGYSYYSWIQQFDYDSDYRLIALDRRPSNMPVGRRITVEYDVSNPDRFQQANIIRQTQCPDPSDATAIPIVTTVEYDPLTTQWNRWTNTIGQERTRDFTHNRYTYLEVRDMDHVQGWGILPHPQDDPSRAAALGVRFGLGDVTGGGLDGDGDGQPDELFVPMRVTWPPVDVPPASGPGQVTSMTPTEIIRYNRYGQPILYRDGGGRAVAFDYEAGELASQTVDPDDLALKQEFTHDALSRLQQVTRADDKVGVLGYDGRGRVGLVRHKATVGQIGYVGGIGAPSAIGMEAYDGQDITKRFYYDLRGRLVGEGDRQFGSSSSVVGDTPFLLIHTVFNEDDTVFSSTSRARNADQSVLVATRTYEYDGRGKEVARNEPVGGVVLSRYDAQGKLLEIQEVGSQGQDRGTAKTEYGPFGEGTKYTTAEGRTTQYFLDGFGRVVREIGPDGLETITDYDDLGRPVEINSGIGLSVIRHGYDALDRVVVQETKRTRLNADGAVEVLTPEWSTVTFGWGAGQEQLLWKAIDSGNGVPVLERYSYNTAGRRYGVSYGFSGDVGTTEVLDEEGRVKSRTYKLDAEGRTGTSSPSEVTVRYAYDLQGRLRRMVAPDDSVTTFYHDANDRPCETVGPNGIHYLSSFDEGGRVLRRWEVSSTGQERVEVECSYNELGNCALMKDGQGRETSFVYNNFGQLITRVLPNGFEYRYVYNKDGQLTRERHKLGAGTNNAWPVIDYSYDMGGRTSTVSATGYGSTLSRTYAYNALGMASVITESVGGLPAIVSQRDWSPEGLILGERHNMAGSSARSVNATRRADGRLAEIVGQTGVAHQYDYDDIGRLSRIRRGASDLVAYDQRYGLQRYRKATYAGGAWCDVDYDPLGRETSRVAKAPGGVALAGGQSYWDASGALLSRTWATDGSQEQYLFDSFDRLSTWTLTGPTARSMTWTWDSVDNLDYLADSTGGSTDPSSNQLNQITAALPQHSSISYNVSGAEIARTGSESSAMTWDPLGRPKSLSHGGSALTFHYDGLHRLVGMSTSTSSTRFDYLEGVVVGYEDGTGIAYDLMYDQAGSLAAREGFGGVLFYQVDWAGNVVGLHNATFGEEYRFTPFGERADVAVTHPVATSAWKNAFYFQQGITEPLTLKTRLGARLYDSRFGRFISRDPLQESGGVNLYAYGKANPTKWQDPTGLAPFPLAGLLLDLASGLAGLLEGAGDSGGTAANGRLTSLYETDSASELMDVFIALGAAADLVTFGNGYSGFLGLPDNEKTDVVRRFYDTIDATDLQIESVRNAHDWAGKVLRAVDQMEVAELLFRLTDLPAFAVEEGALALGATQQQATVAGFLPGLITGAWLKKGLRQAASHLDDLSRAAGAINRNGLTAAGRALQKHGDRAGSAFPRVTGSAGARNAAGQTIVDDILTTPGSTFTNRIAGRFGDVVDVVAPDGRGVRFGSDGSFIGFLEPPR